MPRMTPFGDVGRPGVPPPAQLPAACGARQPPPDSSPLDVRRVLAYRDHGAPRASGGTPGVSAKNDPGAGLCLNPLTLSPDTKKGNTSPATPAPLTPDDAGLPPRAHAQSRSTVGDLPATVPRCHGPLDGQQVIKIIYPWLAVHQAGCGTRRCNSLSSARCGRHVRSRLTGLNASFSIHWQADRTSLSRDLLRLAACDGRPAVVINS
jgi:hypothetical protein